MFQVNQLRNHHLEQWESSISSILSCFRHLFIAISKNLGHLQLVSVSIRKISTSPSWQQSEALCFLRYLSRSVRSKWLLEPSSVSFIAERRG
ncbi:hypothetical protein Nepgr_024667 [Nepenthes gracilis]|uniref:Uncharacterized protein n=1 Tax=Nepenthes gracilis TaxID=150966 RepID=A0AAD3T4X3_NEPGR|nr:hypothetical protein Nepgr_024667 [Nepenthes gracilis]